MPLPTPRTLSRTAPAARLAQACYAQHLTLQQAADACHMSRFGFSHAFKKEHGASFVAFLHQVRLQHAAALLAQQPQAIKTVAYGVGFNDPSYFVRMFRRHYGVTPTAFRSAARFE